MSSYKPRTLRLICFPLIVLCLLFSQLGGTTAATPPSPTEVMRELTLRLLSDDADQFDFKVIPKADGRDIFEIRAHGGKVLISGNNAVSMAAGLNWYLKYYCNCHVSWSANKLSLPNRLPDTLQPVRRTSWAKHRYFLNYCAFGYSLPWWDWDQWEPLIDWMALNGVNLPLSVTGQEGVWQAVGRRLDMSEEAIESMFAGPPYLPFQWMGCLDGWGGPLPQTWIKRHITLQQRILARQRELGMTPVLQGFTGHVPQEMFQHLQKPSAQTVNWVEWKTYILEPTSTSFQHLANLWLEEQSRLFGTDHYYAADPFIEAVPASGSPEALAALGQAIYRGMSQADPKATWILQGWPFTFKAAFWSPERVKALLGAVDHQNMIVLDLYCETKPAWKATDSFYGKPWLWCNVQSFGGRALMAGALDLNNEGIQTLRRSKSGRALNGVGMVNESLCLDHVIYDHLFESAWRDEPVDLVEWTDAYCRRRYGQQNDHVEAAWKVLRETAYNGAKSNRSAITSAPTLQPLRATEYDNARLREAWRLLLDASEQLGELPAYQVDLVNLTRQVLSNDATALQHEIASAYEAQNEKDFRSASEKFLMLMTDLDRMLATREEFLLGNWLENAKRWGDCAEDRRILEWNARRVVSVWGDSPRLRDYSRREWSGMISDFYCHRWKMFLDQVAEDLTIDEEELAELSQSIFEWEKDWSDQRKEFPTEPHGNSVAVSRALWAKYGRQ